MLCAWFVRVCLCVGAEIFCSYGSFEDRCLKKKKRRACQTKNHHHGGGLTKESAARQIQECYNADPEATIAVLKQSLGRLKAREYAKRRHKYTVPSKKEITDTFDILDYNGNGLVSLAEIDKFIVERYPAYDNKPVLIRSMKAADADSDGFITRKEYGLLFQYIYQYDKYWHHFESIDKDGDRRISKGEFNVLAGRVFGAIDDGMFERIDTNQGGYILFREFCDYVVKTKVLEGATP